MDRLEGNGLLPSAGSVDPEGAADFARWVLRHGLPAEGWDELTCERGISGDFFQEDRLIPFASADEFREWAARVRAAPR